MPILAPLCPTEFSLVFFQLVWLKQSFWEKVQLNLFFDTPRCKILNLKCKTYSSSGQLKTTESFLLIKSLRHRVQYVCPHSGKSLGIKSPLFSNCLRQSVQVSSSNYIFTFKIIIILIFYGRPQFRVKTPIHTIVPIHSLPRVSGYFLWC